MSTFTPSEITTLLLGLAVMLFAARSMGELFNRFRQPAIVGEILAGILLGPTVFGNFAPELSGHLFPPEGAVAFGYQTVINLAVILLLLIAGLEIELGVLWRLGRAALIISPLGIAVPFAVGFAAAYFFVDFWGGSPRADELTFALFFGVAMSISALPVIAKMLLDLNLFKSDVGMLIMAAAMFDDLVGWIIFSVVLGLMGGGAAGEAAHGGFGPLATIGLTLGFALFMFTAGRWLIDRVLPWVQSALSWPGGVLGFVLVLTFLGAAATEAIGIHAVFGAFLVGIAVGDSVHFRAQTRTILHQFVTYIFAPIFFVSIGLNANFVTGFNPLLVLGVLAVAFIGKLVGCTLGGKLAGLSRREGLAIAFGMNARGAMEVILGLLALQYGLIEEQMFVALVVLALLSSTVSAPLMSRFVARPKEWKLEELLVSDLYLPALRTADKDQALKELATQAATADGLAATSITPDLLCRAVAARERVYPTGIGHEVAIPRARVEGLPKPVVVVGRSEQGIDFDGADGKPARLIFLVLTPRQDTATAVHLMGQIARLFKSAESRETVYGSDSFQVLRALVKAESAVLAGH